MRKEFWKIISNLYMHKLSLNKRYAKDLCSAWGLTVYGTCQQQKLH